MARIVVVSWSPAKFVHNDVEILSGRHEVEWFRFRFTPRSVWRLLARLRTCDLAFCWFGSVWSALAVAFGHLWGTKTVVVAGGSDVARLRGVRFPPFYRPIQKLCARYALRRADKILAVSRTNERELLAFVRPRAETLVYNCVNCPPAPKGLARKRQVLTVGHVSRWSSARKGHFRFLEVARKLPDVPFLLAGRDWDGTIHALRRAAPANVAFLGFVEPEELTKLYCESKVYLQLSLHEAFGISVAEAMWYGCTPIVSANGALPEVVADTGVILQDIAPESATEAVRRVLDEWPEVNQRAMQRAREFSFERRQRRLLEEVEAVLSNRRSVGRRIGSKNAQPERTPVRGLASR
ncbi:MAG: glycosyltransferase family 4 protein [Thermoguttaceae bacterium]